MMTIADLARAFQTLVKSIPEARSCAEARPSHCTKCGAPARVGPRLVLIGHGLYYREVTKGQVRRYLCRACRATCIALPRSLHPRRWLPCWMMLLAVYMVLVRGSPATGLSRWFGEEADSEAREMDRWQGRVRRWCRALLDGLWPGLAGRLGVSGPACTREEQRSRLTLLLSEAGLEPESQEIPSPSTFDEVARSLCEWAVEVGR